MNLLPPVHTALSFSSLSLLSLSLSLSIFFLSLSSHQIDRDDVPDPDADDAAIFCIVHHISQSENSSVLSDRVFGPALGETMLALYVMFVFDSRGLFVQLSHDNQPTPAPHAHIMTAKDDGHIQSHIQGRRLVEQSN